MTMSEIRDRIILQMKKENLRQVDVHTRINVSRGTVSQWVAGQNTPKGDNLKKLASVLKCSAKWLAFGDDDDSPVYPIEAWDSATPLHADDIELPLFREIELSAGSGRTEVIENHGAKLRFAKSSLAKQGVCEESAACCFVSGDSMEPVLPDGSTVGIDTSKKSIIDGKMYAIDYSGMLRVKLLYRIPGGIKIRSVNRDYDDEVITGESLDTVRIIGKVFWSASFHS